MVTSHCRLIVRSFELGMIAAEEAHTDLLTDWNAGQMGRVGSWLMKMDQAGMEVGYHIDLAVFRNLEAVLVDTSVS